MWNRKELKNAAKHSIKMNYIACIAVCFIMMFIAGEYESTVQFISKYDAKNVANLKYDTDQKIEIVKEIEQLTGGDLLKAGEDQISKAVDKISEKYDYIYVLANSIGAYFTMHTLQNFKIEKALFISPILDMEQLIVDMMSWANVSEKELSERKEIPTDFGETLSWEYLCFVRANPINWKTPTEILYAEHDNLTSRQTVDKFIDRHCANLTVMNDGEHWFHTDEQIFFRDNWLRKVIQ